MKYKLVIFDMDGTILDTLQDLQNCLNYALEKNGYPGRTYDEVRRFVGNGLEKLVERAMPKDMPEEAAAGVLVDFKEYYKVHCMDYTKPYDGIVELLRVLRKRGYQTAVVSNKTDFAVQELVKEYFQGMFDAAVGAREGQEKKPAPDSVYTVLEQLMVPREDAVYIGDSEVDIETAKNAGLECITVEWGFRERAYLEKMGAVCFVRQPSEILELV